MTAFAGDQSYVRIRLADAGDAPHIHRLIHQTADYQHHVSFATINSLTATFFPTPPPPPFYSFTVFLLELSPAPFLPLPTSSSPHFAPIHHTLDSALPVNSADESGFGSDENENGGDTVGFESSCGDGSVVVGFVLFYPNYSTFLGKPGFYVEDLFVRERYRRRGLGRMLLAAVAAQAARMGFGQVKWLVLDWNENAIEFYKGMGAEVLQEWRVCRLSGDALRGYGGGGGADGSEPT